MDPTSFSNDAWADRIKARYRATAAKNARDWAEAERQLNEELRLIRQAEAQGYGSYSRTQALEDLDEVRAAQAP